MSIQMGGISYQTLAFTFNQISNFKTIPFEFNEKNRKPEFYISNWKFYFPYFCAFNTLSRVAFQIGRFLTRSSSDGAALDGLWIVSFLIAGIFHVVIITSRLYLAKFLKEFVESCHKFEKDSLRWEYPLTNIDNNTMRKTINNTHY